MKKNDNQPLTEKQNYKVVKSNDLIQKSRFRLSLQEQRVILYLISQIKPEEMQFKEYVFEIVDFCQVCGMHKDSGSNYKHVRQALKNLRDKSIWIETEDGSETTLAWIDKITISAKSGFIKIKIDDMMKPYLLQLREKFTQYELLYTLAMKSQYSVRLYELLKSYEYLHGKTFTVEELKKKLDAEKYVRWADFTRYVLDTAIREINRLSDITVTCAFEKKGRSYAKIKLSVKRKRNTDERLETWRQIESSLSQKKKSSDSQKDSSDKAPNKKQ